MGKETNQKIYNRLIALSEQFKSAKRLGGGRDFPEGVRYIIVSDILASQMGDFLKDVSARFNEYENKVTGEGFEK